MQDVIDKDKKKKFFFDLNVFDEHIEEEPEEPEEPPPPTYTEEELEAARAEEYARGKADAFEESRKIREQFVAEQLKEIAKNLAPVLEAERVREQTYEQESLVLTSLVFERLFPLFNEKYGFDEVLETIRQTLSNAAGQKRIVIEVSAGAAEGIQAHMADLSSRLDLGQIEIRGSDDLGPGSCRLGWNDGGAVRDAQNIAQKILKDIEGLLAGRGSGIPPADDDINRNQGHADQRLEIAKKAYNPKPRRILPQPGCQKRKNHE